MLELMDSRDVLTQVRARLDSLEWYVFPWINSLSADISIAIEQLVPNGDDFEVVMGGIPGCSAIAFIRKSGISDEDLAKVLASKVVNITPEMLVGHDILIVIGEDAEIQRQSLLNMQMWNAWLTGNLILA